MKKLYKIYKDGNHFVATEKQFNKSKSINKKEKTDEDLYFDELYFDAILQRLNNGELRHYLVKQMLEKFPNIEDIYNFVEEHIKNKIHNFYSRMKRFKRKANLNSWNYFITITYDSKKMDAETFKRKLRKCLSNLHCRRNWRYMGVYELSPTENRLHFHALVNIPNGEMIGELYEKQDYSTKHHCMQTTIQNTFFNEKFGRCDFTALTKEDITYGRVLEYLTKYLSKTGEKIVYSRGVPTEIERIIDTRDVATEFVDFVVKYVLFDDILDSDLNYIDYGQQSLFAG